MKQKFIYTVILWLLFGNTLCGQTEDPLRTGFDNNFLYERYASREDLTVAQLRHYPVDTTLFVNVVMLKANDDEAWVSLQTEFQVFPFTTEVTNEIAEGAKVSHAAYRDAFDPTKSAPMLNEKEVDILHSCMLIASYNTNTIWIFHYQTQDEAFAIIHNYYSKKYLK